MTVYATQCPMIRIPGQNGSFQLEPKFKLGPDDPQGRALREQYGELVWLLEPNNAPWTPGVMDRLRLGLENYTKEDHLLLLGNPILMSMMAVFAGEVCDTLRFLQWSNGGYVSFGVDLNV